MQTFTYRVELFGTENIVKGGEERFSNRLNELGRQGWEAVSMVVLADGPVNPVVILFKQPGSGQ